MPGHAAVPYWFVWCLAKLSRPVSVIMVEELGEDVMLLDLVDFFPGSDAADLVEVLATHRRARARFTRAVRRLRLHLHGYDGEDLRAELMTQAAILWLARESLAELGLARDTLDWCQNQRALGEQCPAPREQEARRKCLQIESGFKGLLVGHHGNEFLEPFARVTRRFNQLAEAPVLTVGSALVGLLAFATDERLGRWLHHV